MNLDGKTVWQQAAGDTDRNYVDICLRWGVILNGPGYAGSWPECAPVLRKDGGSARKTSDLRRFAEEIKDGDIVVLRLGTSVVPGVGLIVGPYEWRDEFGDIDGWDLQHVRRVRWLWDGRAAPMQFETYAMKQGDTTQRLNQGAVMDWLKELPDVPTITNAQPLTALPENGAGLSINVEEISEFLFDCGVASASITRLLNEMGELTRIASWYRRSLNAPSEHETVAYLVVPLLRALGWTPQRMAVEWNWVDVALFDSLPRGDQSLCAVVEAKKMSNACLSANSQAAGYAEGKPGCNRLIVTDGLRYGVLIRATDRSFELFAYLNLTSLRRDYPVYGCRGAEDALLAMTPDWRPASTGT